MTEPRVALVLVSHSRALAEGVAELAGQMAPDVLLVTAGGTDDGRLGTGFDVVAGALDRAVADGRSAVVLTDLGSALLTTESVLEFAEAEVATRVRLVDAPFVEGAVEAAVAAQGGGELAEVAQAAERAALSFAAVGASGSSPAEADTVSTTVAGTPPPSPAGPASGSPPDGKDADTSGAEASGGVDARARGASPESDEGRRTAPEPGPPAPGPSGEAGREVTARGTAVLRNRLGLHARPAGRLARTAGAFRSAIEVNGVDARSVLALVGLGAVGGTQVVVTATGPDARTAVRAVVAEIEDGFGEA